MKTDKRKMRVFRIGALLVTALLIFTTAVFAAGQTAAKDEIDLSGATSFVFADAGITVKDGAYSGYKVDGTALTIKEGGVYVVSGSCAGGSIVVGKNVTGVTLVLDGLTLSASATAPLTCNKGSEVKIVAAAGTVSNLADDKYNNDDIYTDEALYPDIENAVIKCKDGSNVTLCGSGTLNITANGKNGVKGGGDLYGEDTDGNATDTLLSAASLTVKELTLSVTANAGDGLKADKELNLLSGNITVSAADDGIKCDDVMNIGADGTKGPTVSVVKSKEGIEAATLNVCSGNVTVNATDDGINAANSDLTNYGFAYNQYGGYVYVNVTNGDGVDSNGVINLAGGTLEVHAPAQGDGDPLDSESGTNFGGATVLAVGHLGMMQGYTADTPYVTFGAAGGFGGSQTALVSAGGSVQITDESGNVLYETKAVRNASYILFASSKLTSGAAYLLKNGNETAASATAGTASVGGMGMGNPGAGRGQMPAEGQFPGAGRGQMPAEGQFPGAGRGQMPAEGQFPGAGRGQMPAEGQFPGAGRGQMPAEGQFPDAGRGQMPAEGQFPDAGRGQMPAEGQFPGADRGQMPANGQTPDGGETTARADSEVPPQGTQERGKDARSQTAQKVEEKTNPSESGAALQQAPKTEQRSNWFFNMMQAIGNFFKSLFGRK